MLYPKKSLGQNFLKDNKVLDEFIKACKLSKEDTVVEVGGGTGVITKAIAPLVSRLITYEFDVDLAEKYLIPLKEIYSNLEIVSGDVLEKLEASGKRPGAIIGAIPYQISSPLLHKAVREFYATEKRPKIVFIIQKEVAQKICTKPPKASYFSNFVELYGRAEIVGEKIPPSSFWPAPKVDSAILKIIPHNKKIISVEDLNQFEKFLHHGFKNPRKMLNKVFDIDVLEKAEIDSNLRSQALTLNDWVQLFGIVRA